MFIKKHNVHGNEYFSLTESVREGNLVKHKYVQYLGRNQYVPGTINEYIPMQPITVLKTPQRYGTLTEEKKDGVRSLYYGDKEKGFLFLNRRKNIKNKEYPEFIGSEQKLKANQEVLDGELVVYDKKGKDDFKLLSQRDHLKNPELIKKRSKEFPATYEAFDVLEKDGKYVGNLPIEKRKEILNEIIPDNLKEIKKVKYSMDPVGATRKLKSDPSVEGAVYKATGSKYFHGKDKSWLKQKFHKKADTVIIGYEEGKGKRKGMVGAIHIGIFKDGKIKSMGKVGSGFNDKEGKELKDELDKIKIGADGNIILVKPKLFAAIKYLKLGSTGNALREGIYIGQRTDILLKDTHV